MTGLRIIDGHLDLAMNAQIGRDQTLPVAAIREAEAGIDRSDRGTATVSLPDLREAGVGAVVGTLFARSRPDAGMDQCRQRSDADYPARSIAHAAACGQLAYYRWLERAGWITMIETREDLRRWRTQEAGGPIGCVLLVEGADPITAPDEFDAWWAWGVRMVALAHYGASAYAVGTGEEGPVTPAGRELLERMAERGAILDLSHLSDTSFREALSIYEGPVVASHSACRRFSGGSNRQLDDEQIRAVADRGGVIGIPIHNAMLREGWSSATSTRAEVPLRTVGEHLDHVCQVTGSADHAAIGSDLDGGFGLESIPSGLETIADLPHVLESLAGFGYDDHDLRRIAAGNWERVFEAGLPAAG